MARIPSNIEIPSIDFVDSSQLTNWILDSGLTCHTTPDISDSVPDSLVEKDKYIEVADQNFVTEKQTGEVQIKMCNDNSRPFISELYNILFAPGLCDQLLSIIILIHS